MLGGKMSAGSAGMALTILAAIGFAVWLLGEPLSFAQMIGAALVITGIAVIGRRPGS